MKSLTIVDPCDDEGDDPFFNIENQDKSCIFNSDTGVSTLTVLRQLGRSPGVTQVTIREGHDVPGLSNLGLFGIRASLAGLSAIEMQEETGKYYGGLDSDSIRERNAAEFRIDANTKALFFNLPFCDMDTIELSEIQQSRQRLCDTDRFDENPEMCKFNMLMNCGCSNLRLGGEDWPFQKGGDTLCVLEAAGL
jgi:hypothetical protein